MTAVLTSVGATLWATSIQTNGAQTAVAYVSVGYGTGVLTAALNNSTMYSSIAITPSYTGTIANGQSLTLLDSGGDTQIVTSSASTAITSGVNISIPVTSFTASAMFAIGSGLVNTPAVTDTALQNEGTRVAATPGSPGAAAGESLNAGYFGPTAVPTGLYLEVGYYGGSTATSTLGTGTMIARDVQFWIHAYNADSAFLQLDSTL
jgi:hypothetical protein